ncbi:MAG: exodeoxyribonuclease III [Pseudomonadota bacterium]
MKLVTWNVNSVRARFENLQNFLQREQPDIVCLQEIKCQDHQFPAEDIEDLGYNIALHGQKSYNGVAVLSKYPLSDVEKGLPGFDDEQARFITADISIQDKMVHIVNCYMPNGNPRPGPKFDYKIAWMQALISYIRNLRDEEVPFILCGDFNIIPKTIDVHDPAAWADDALYMPEIINFFNELIYMGLVDTVRHFNPHDPAYSFWDYQGRAREKNHGIRIDHILPSPEVIGYVQKAYIIDSERDTAKASDHAPVALEAF